MKTIKAKRNTKINTPWGVIEYKAGETMRADVYTNICGLVEVTAHTKCNVYLGSLEASDWEVSSPAVELRMAA
jgi:hypothetical protein